MKPRIGVCAGSFDPPTNGHAYMFGQGSKLFDTLIVVLAVNNEKKALFSKKERLEMLAEVLKKSPNVEIEELGNIYLADFAKKSEALWALRGMRDILDFTYEMRMRDENARLNPALETITVFQPENLRRLSSSWVKSLVGPENWENAVREYLPTCVYPKFIEKYKTMEKVERLRERWYKICYRLGATGDIERIFNEIIARYRESHRFYHILDHILDCLEKFDKIRHLAVNPLALELAIILHDIINKPSPGLSDANNVYQSILLAMELLKELHLDFAFIRIVSHLILSTKHDHVPTEKDSCLMVDIDLSSLGSEPEVFDQNTANIRREYPWISDQDFDRGRVQFFIKLLENRPSIFLTEYFQSRYKDRAQDNIRRYLSQFK